jgi:hypothetical protein
VWTPDYTQIGTSPTGNSTVIVAWTLANGFSFAYAAFDVDMATAVSIRSQLIGTPGSYPPPGTHGHFYNAVVRPACYKKF